MMSEPQSQKTVTLDDADPERRNEALLVDIDALEEELAEREQQLKDLSDRVVAMHGVQTIGLLPPEEAQKVR